MNDENLDPTSLTLLEDIMALEPVSWWPLAPAWWALIAIVTLCAVAGSWIGWRRWRTNAYRRAAVRELEALDENACSVPALLKRVALAVWPRTEVASLSGDSWIAFLREASPNSFDNQSAADLLQINYETAELTTERREQLIRSARHWITTHRGPGS